MGKMSTLNSDILHKIIEYKSYESGSCVFVTTNEVGLPETFKVLEKAVIGCHVGVSGWHNYDIAVRTNATSILIFDLNTSTVKFHEDTLKNLKASATRDEFIKKMAESIFFDPKLMDPANGCKYSVLLRDKKSGLVNGDLFQSPNLLNIPQTPASYFNHLKEAMRYEESWLSTDAKFEQIKKLAQENKICALNLDLCDEASFDLLSKYLKSNVIIVSTLYLANVYEWIRGDKKSPQADSFIRNVQKLVNPRTIVIDTVRARVHGITELGQNVVFAEDPISKVAYSPETIRGYRTGETIDFDADEEFRNKSYPGALSFS